MEHLNESVGLIALITLVVTVFLLLLLICLVVSLRNRLAVQKLKFVGLFSTDGLTRGNYSKLTIGNRSLNEVGLAELGIRNGDVSFDLTEIYRERCSLNADSRIYIEQRSSISFTLTEEELRRVLIDGKKGPELKRLRIYAVDLTGNQYKGRIRAVEKLLKISLSREKHGIYHPAYASPAAPASVASETPNEIAPAAAAPAKEKAEKEERTLADA